MATQYLPSPPALSIAPRVTLSWTGRYARMLLAGDCAVIAVALLAAWYGPFPVRPGHALLIGAIWPVVLKLARCYDRRIIGHGSDEYRRIVGGTAHLAGLVAIACYVLGTPVARSFVVVAFPLGALGLLAERYAARKWLHRRRRDGCWSHRVLVVGDPGHTVDLAHRLRREPYTGYRPVGECRPGDLESILRAIARTRADIVAVTSSRELTGRALRTLGWALHDTGVALVVVPGLTDIAGPRIHTRPVGGLPLLHVEEPELDGLRRAAKSLIDRFMALVALLALSPVLLAVAVAVKADGPGPAIFRQTRIGRHGRPFTMYKFRSMRPDAEALRPALAALSERDGAVFKIRRDPRVTRVGHYIRTWSLDELPQLVNVLKGDMSLVGPRPPLPDEVAAYEADTARRLLVTPGITGLWQVSGRADLSWEDTVRLDLYYVENWSPAADLVILWKTMGAVLRRRGAY